MITVIASETGGPLDTVLAENLAVLRRGAGRRVLLIDTAPEQAARAWARARAGAHLRPLPEVLALRGMGFGERLARLHEGAHDSGHPRHDEIVVAAGACDSPECRSALVAAQVAIVPIAARDADPAGHYRLIARLNAARMFNPGLRVLFAALGDAGTEEDLTPAGMARIRGYAREVMAGQVAPMPLDAEALRVAGGGTGTCVCDGDGASTPALAALDALCAVAFGHPRQRAAAPPAALALR